MCFRIVIHVYNKIDKMQKREKSKSKQSTKPQFVLSFSKSNSRYDPILDKNLQYYFANKQNRKVLRQHRIINAKNEIIDKKVTKIALSGEMKLNNGFRISRKMLAKTIDIHKDTLPK